MTEYEKKILDGIADCRRTGLICLSAGAFLYVGSLLPQYHEPADLLVLQISSFLFLISSGLFYWRTVILRQKLHQ
ncbi:YrhC family protein [Sporolactobacillus vineae]|uniref:YrhC family protein n=1 Tax=Sporolactobacillus vineae TaxID=444463 RepID=UPI000289785F|nr:YrhC family protein [Sporolactobacillus vineae]